MARPKSAKKRDRVPASSSSSASAAKVNKKTVFDEDGEVNPTDLEKLQSGEYEHAKEERNGDNTDENENEEEAPEVISSSSAAEMKKLQELHAIMSSNKKKRKKKQKPTGRENEVVTNEDAELDESIFEEVEKYEAEKLDGDESLDQDGIQECDSPNAGETHIRFKKTGNISVNALDSSTSEDGRGLSSTSAISSFCKSKVARNFLQQQEMGVKRERYSRFAGQKSIGPAKKFRSK